MSGSHSAFAICTSFCSSLDSSYSGSVNYVRNSIITLFLENSLKTSAQIGLSDGTAVTRLARKLIKFLTKNQSRLS